MAVSNKYGHPEVVSDQEARQGIMLGHMRYVLAVSLTLAVVAGVFLWLAFFH